MLLSKETQTLAETRARTERLEKDGELRERMRDSVIREAEELRARLDEV